MREAAKDKELGLRVAGLMASDKEDGDLLGGDAMPELEVLHEDDEEGKDGEDDEVGDNMRNKRKKKSSVEGGRKKKSSKKIRL